MIQVLHPAEIAFDVPALARRLGFRSGAFSGAHISGLSHSTADAVYLIPEEVIARAAWAKLRVHLAQANRLYLGCVRSASSRNVVRALREGCFDVVSVEDADERWKEAIIGAAEHQKLWLQLYGARPLNANEVLLGKSQAMQRLRETVRKLGPTDVCVLIQGESGVGKERVASALHEAGRGGDFVALNCAAIPRDLLEAELFGVEKGAFTGALKSRAGLVEQAAGGTLFLDEIGEMELSVQPKLLRFLETRRARRVGGESEYKVKVRVVAATNRNLELEIAEKRFRPDLFYRLAEVSLQPPPLRTRPEDIPELALTFVAEANERFGKNFETIEPGLIQRFQQYRWPGNVRELKSAINRLILLFDGPVLRSSWWDLPASDATSETTAPPAPGAADVAAGTAPASAAARTGVPRVPSRAEKYELAKRLLRESNHNYTWVAGQLGVNTSTLWRWREAGKLG